MTETNYSNDYAPLNSRAMQKIYTPFIGRLRIGLFGLAIILLLGVALWSNKNIIILQSSSIDGSGVGLADVSLSVSHARYAGLESGELPFTITAEKIVQTKTNSRDLALVSPQADILLESGGWLYIRAHDGVIEEDSHRILLDNEVILNYSDGYQVSTGEARMNMKLGIIFGDAPVVAEGLSGSMRSEGFRVHDSGKIFELVGPAHLSLRDDGDDIKIFAEDSIKWLDSENKYQAEGGVIVNNGQSEFRTERLDIFYHKSGSAEQVVERMVAIGDVVLLASDSELYADVGIYEISRDLLLFSGDDLRLLSPDVELSADDALEYWLARDVAIARGNARVSSSGRELSADVISARIDFRDGFKRLSTASASGNVVVVSDDAEVRGKDGHYDFVSGTGQICGDLQIIKSGHVLSGECAEISLSGDSIGSEVRAIGGAGGQVEGIFGSGG